ncbi:hypothetical protein [Desertibacillus haloalkaliphilus]|uniref:hypothetical protein n=1 Tax=Desertibacillus haloalkaliphilus TaxID=1328930 RepID=UPI001C275A24|nr:hypothetical protein [Desertibacillus haloalkaliphilus]MBU8905250.1 hypothetical protein [Desertibacillus haloalkaliphilus]
MLNQPQAVFSYTIPYFISNDGESIELFVSEKTYEKYLQVQSAFKMTIISGDIHPLGRDLGLVTTTLFDADQAILIIGTKDIADYSNELLDISIATELERILQFDPNRFFHYLYSDQTPEHIQMFIDDIQQTLEDIAISKRLAKAGYRIDQREEEMMESIVANADAFHYLKKEDPIENKDAQYVLMKLFFVYHFDKTLYKSYKQKLHGIYPRLFIEHEQLQKQIQKFNLSTEKGQARALDKLFQTLGYQRFVQKITVADVPKWELPVSQ